MTRLRKRTNHGRDRELRGERTVLETVTEPVAPAPDGSAAPVERGSDGRVTPAGAAVLARMRWEAATMPDFGDSAAPWLPPAPALAPFHDARAELLNGRRNELHAATGGVDRGTGAILRGWAYMHAAGEYWASDFFATGNPESFERMVRAFKAASAEEARARDAAVWAAQTRRSIDPGAAHRAALAAFSRPTEPQS
jgi:hypothetical protein